MSRRPACPRWGSDGAILTSRRAIAVALRRHPDSVTRHCTPVACDVESRALLYDLDESCAILEQLLPGTSRAKRR
jgi:hypothetical protein